MRPPTFQASKAQPAFWGLVFLVVAITSVNCALTQYMAYHFGYQRALGSPWLGHIYNPFAWNLWQFQYYRKAKLLFDQLDIVSLAAYVGILLIAALIQGFTNRKSKKHDGLHGTAHWATETEVRRTGLIPKPGKRGSGVYVGAWVDPKGQTRYLRHNGPEHIAAIAPTRSGKGVGLVIPTLLSWPHSTIVHDMKGELWNLTAGWRQTQAGNKVLKFDPAAESGSCGFNPLDEVRIGTDSEVADVQNLVSIIVDPDGKGLNDHWMKTAHAFLTGLILHLLYKAKIHNEQNPDAEPLHTSLWDVALALSDPNQDISKLYDEMLAFKHQGNSKTPNQMTTHSVVASAARDMLNTPNEERGSILSSTRSYLTIYRDPLVKANIQRSDFSIRDLMHHTHPVSLYLVVRPADKDRLKPLMRLILNQIVRTLTREEIQFKDGQPQANYQHRLLLMLDEFPSFGRLEIFQEALAFIAGYGIKAYLIMQDISQLRAAYGQDESILSNCHVRVAYAPNKPETAEWLSKMTGTTTVTVEDVSTSGHRFGAILQNVNQSYQTVARPLLTSDECQRLPGPEKDERSGEILKPGAMLIFTAGFAPIYGTQILYFVDPVFSERAKLAPPPKTDRLEPKKETVPLAMPPRKRLSEIWQ